MAEVNAEGINIAAVAESSQGADPPPTTGWLNLEADAIGDPGPAYKKMARNPFTITRQLRRPFIAGLDCTLTLDVDAIKDHIDFFGEAMFKSDWKHSGGTATSFHRPTVVVDGGVGADSFTVAAAGAYQAGLLIVTRGFAEDENNGVFVVAAGSDADSVNVATGTLVAEASAPANATLEVCGVQGAAGDIELDGSGNLTSTTLDFTTLGLQVHQFIYIPSQAEALVMGDVKYAFDNADYYGFAEITAISANLLTLRRRGWTVGAADPAADNLIRVFFTKWIRNVARSHADENLVSHAFEVTYPGLATGPADAYEYLLGYMLDEVTFDIPSEGKVAMQMSFVGKTASDPATGRETGPSVALNVVTSLALSTSSDVTRLSIDDVDENGLMTDFQNLKIALRNNITPAKAVAHLGNRFTPLGVFEAQVEAEVFFTTPEIVSCVSSNEILRLAAGMRNDDFGLLIDIPSTGAMQAPKKIEHNQLVSVSSQVAGFMDADSGFTAGMSVFAYLPKA
jgi:hypothetical protein